MCKPGIKESWSALHNKSGFISFFLVLCSAAVPNHYTLEKISIKIEVETKEKQNKV